MAVLVQNCIQQWKSQLNVQEHKLRFYKLFKDSFVREAYLDNLNSFDLRKCVAKFRCSDHKLEVEIGRHKKQRLEERICQICYQGVETELHLLQECPLSLIH